MPEHHCAQNADHLAPNTLFSRFFAEVVCDLGATPPQTVTPLPPNGGIYAIQGSDTPTSHRQSASHGAKPPPTPSHQHVTLHIPRARWNARPSPLTEQCKKVTPANALPSESPASYRRGRGEVMCERAHAGLEIAGKV